MKKSLFIVLAAMICILAVCGAAAAEAKDHYVIYDIVKIDGTYFNNEAKGLASKLKELSEKYGFTYDFHYFGTDNDPEKHMTSIENAIADKADVIITCVPDQTMSLAVKERCEEAGILLIAVDDGIIDDEGNKIVPWRGIDAYNIGYAAGTWGANYILEHNLVDDPEAGILYQTMDTVSSCVPRINGEIDAVHDIIGDAMDSRSWRADYQTTTELAYESSSAVITAHPEIKRWVIMNASENGTMAAAALVDEQGLEDSVIVSLGADQCVQQWPEGNWYSVQAATYFSGVKIGMQAIEDAIEYLINGTEMELEFAVPAVIVNKDNYTEYYINPDELVYDPF